MYSYYFFRKYKYETVLGYLERFHDIRITRRTLLNCLTEYGLRLQGHLIYLLWWRCCFEPHQERTWRACFPTGLHTYTWQTLPVKYHQYWNKYFCTEINIFFIDIYFLLQDYLYFCIALVGHRKLVWPRRTQVLLLKHCTSISNKQYVEFYHTCIFCICVYTLGNT